LGDFIASAVGIIYRGEKAREVQVVVALFLSCLALEERNPFKSLLYRVLFAPVSPFLLAVFSHLQSRNKCYIILYLKYHF